MALAACAALAFGSSWADRAARGALDISVPLGIESPILCEGIVHGEVRDKRWGVSFDMMLASCADASGRMEPAHGGVRVNSRGAPDGLADGDMVRVPMIVRRPKNFLGDGGFDYRRYLMSRGIAAIGSARGRVELIGTGDAGLVSAIVRGGRARIDRSIGANLGGDEAAVVRALALGDRSDITRSMREQFSRAGIAHLLALSGLHVGYVALIAFLIIRCTVGLIPPLVSRLPLRMIAAALTIPAVWIYVAFTGGAISAVRAGLMLTAYLVGVLVLRRPDLVTTIAAAVVAILAASPLAVLSVSFQLSVVAVLGIALLGLPMMRMLRIDVRRGGLARRSLSWLGATAIVSLAATLSTAPVVAYHFKTVTAAGLVANVVAVPLAGLVLQPLVIAAQTVAAAAPGAAGGLWHAAGAAAGWLIAIARAASTWGAPLVVSWSPGAAELTLAYAAIIAVAFSRKLRWGWARLLRG